MATGAGETGVVGLAIALEAEGAFDSGSESESGEPRFVEGEVVSDESGWRNRIVGQGMARVDELIPNPMNYRTHPKLQQEGLGAVLGEVGWVDTILVNRRTGNVIDGHLRLEMSKQSGEEFVPVTWVDLSLEEERIVLMTFDPLTHMAETSREALRKLTENVGLKQGPIQEMLDKLGWMNEKPKASAPATKFRVIIECDTEAKRAAVMQDLSKLGYPVKAGK